MLVNIFRLSRNQTEFCLVSYQLGNSKCNLISVYLTTFRIDLSVCTSGQQSFVVALLKLREHLFIQVNNLLLRAWYLYLVTMIPLIWIGFSVSFNLLSLVYIFVSFLGEQNPCKHWQALFIINYSLLNTRKYYTLLPKTYPTYC